MTKRQEINQALSKALLAAKCGNFEESQRWGEVLLRKLELAAVFKAGAITVNEPLTLWVGGDRPLAPIGWREIEGGAK